MRFEPCIMPFQIQFICLRTATLRKQQIERKQKKLKMLGQIN